MAVSRAWPAFARTRDVGNACIYIFTYSMEESHFWEGNRFAASQEIPRISWNPMFITAFSRARHLSLSWGTPIHSTPPSHFLEIHLNIILPSTPGSSKWSLSPQVSPPNSCMHLFSTPYVLHVHPSHSSRFKIPDNIWWRVHIIEFLIMQCSPLLCYLFPLRPQRPIL